MTGLLVCDLAPTHKNIDSQVQHSVRRLNGHAWELRDRSGKFVLATFYGFEMDLDNFRVCKSAEAEMDDGSICGPVR